MEKMGVHVESGGIKVGTVMVMVILIVVLRWRQGGTS